PVLLRGRRAAPVGQAARPRGGRGASVRRGGAATERRSTIGAAAPAGPTYRRARRPLRALRHEHAFGAATGVRRLSADALWWLALAERRPGARARPGALRPARRRPRRRALKPAPASCRERAGC